MVSLSLTNLSSQLILAEEAVAMLVILVLDANDCLDFFVNIF